jgi:hypothetical protein
MCIKQLLGAALGPSSSLTRQRRFRSGIFYVIFVIGAMKEAVQNFRQTDARV